MAKPEDCSISFGGKSDEPTEKVRVDSEGNIKTVKIEKQKGIPRLISVHTMPETFRKSYHDNKR